MERARLALVEASLSLGNICLLSTKCSGFIELGVLYKTGNSGPLVLCFGEPDQTPLEAWNLSVLPFGVMRHCAASSRLSCNAATVPFVGEPLPFKYEELLWVAGSAVGEY